ncbi:MAG: PQQ-binding-like beta-propeller repeat protein [Verrucomicrobiota bacterium]
MKTLAIIVLTLFPIVASADWPFRGPDHNSIVKTDFKPASEPIQIWKAEVGAGHSSCIVAGGKVFTIGDSQLQALDAKSGELLWKKDVANTWGAPTHFEGKVYTLGGVTPPVAACYSAETGEEIWRLQLPKTVCAKEYFHCSPPLIWEDLIILNAGGGTAVKRDTGELVWNHPGIAGMAPTVVCELNGKTAVAIFGGERCVFRDPRSGDELTSIPWKGEDPTTAADPLFFENKVLLSSAYGAGRALFDLTANPPSEIWAKRGADVGHTWASTISIGGELYGFTKSAFICIDAESGEAKWERPSLAGSVTILGDYALVLTEKGELHIGKLTPDEPFESSLIAQLSGGKTWSLPAYHEGNFVIRNDKGEVFCWKIES